MNQVSDPKLAIAVYKAGGLPSLSAFNYLIKDEVFQFDKLEEAIVEFVRATNSSNFLLSLRSAHLSVIEIKQLVIKYKIPYLELVEFEPIDVELAKFYKELGVLLLVKRRTVHLHCETDGIVLKGPDGAGRIPASHIPLTELLIRFKKLHPNKIIIVSGGIGTSEQVKEYIELGADLVGVGTLFAVSTESSISTATKLKMVSSSSDNLQQFGKAHQQGLVFDMLPVDVLNKTKSLQAGIKSPDSGIIFAGKGLDNITKISTVTEIMQDLIKHIKV